MRIPATANKTRYPPVIHSADAALGSVDREPPYFFACVPHFFCCTTLIYYKHKQDIMEYESNRHIEFTKTNNFT